MISINNTLKFASAYIATRTEAGGFKLKQISQGEHSEEVYNSAVHRAGILLNRPVTIPGESFVIRSNDRYGNHEDVFEDKVKAFMSKQNTARESAEAVITSWAINHQDEFNRLAS